MTPIERLRTRIDRDSATLRVCRREALQPLPPEIGRAHV